MTLQWPHNARLAVSLVVNVEEGAELNILDADRGPDPVDELGIALRKPVRNHGNESNYRYGINRGAGRILELLDSFGIRATFTAAAVALERAPQVAKGIVAGRHEVCAHGHRWVQQMGMDEDTERSFISDAVTSIETTTGSRPLGWLSRYLHTDLTRQLLVEAGFLYSMDDFSDDAPFWEATPAGPIVIVPYALDSNDMKIWNAPALTPDDWLKYALDTFDCLWNESQREPLMMSLGVHLRIMGRPGRVWALREFIERVSAMDGVWFATRTEIARQFADSCPPPPM